MAEKSSEPNGSEPSGSKPSGNPKHEDNNAGNWWDSWLSSAKTKSAEMFDMVKKDLDELGTAVKSEASNVFTTTSTVIGKTLKLDEPESPANVMKKSFSTFIGQVSTVLNPEPDDEDDTEVILSSGDTTMLSTYKKELEALQRVDATFIVPAYSPEFEAWRASLELRDEDVISPTAACKRLAASALLKQQYDKLVPDAVSHQHFWERYMFRVALLQDRLAAASRKQPLDEQTPTTDPVLAHLPLQHAHTPTPPPVIQESPKKALSGLDTETEPEDEDIPPGIDKVVAWEDEDFANDVELTEEQQILLLEEYEKEIASKKSTKQTSTKDIANNNLKNKTTNTKPGNTKNKTQNREKIINKTPEKNNKLATTKNKEIIDKKNKNVRLPQNKTAPKPDVCGNNLVEDYFGDKDVTKDDASANSDESWEKEFEIEDVELKA